MANTAAQLWQSQNNHQRSEALRGIGATEAQLSALVQRDWAALSRWARLRLKAAFKREAEAA